MLSSMQDMTKLVAATSKALPAGSKRSAGHLQLLADLEDIQDAWWVPGPLSHLHAMWWQAVLPLEQFPGGTSSAPQQHDA